MSLLHAGWYMQLLSIYHVRTYSIVTMIHRANDHRDS
jgi:hypothetical protein